MSNKIIKMFQPLSESIKAEQVSKSKSQFEVKEAWIYYANLNLFLIVLLHFVTFAIGHTTASKLGFNPFLSFAFILIAEICMGLAMISASKYSISKKQLQAKRGDLILSGKIIPMFPSATISYLVLIFFGLIYYGMIIYFGYTKTLSNARLESEVVSYSDTMELNNIQYVLNNSLDIAERKFKQDSLKYNSLINEEIKQKSVSLLSEKASILRDLNWRKSNGFDYSSAVSQLSSVENRIKSIGYSKRYKDSLNSITNRFIAAKENASFSYSKKKEGYLSKREERTKSNVFLETIKVLMLDIILIIVVFVQKMSYSALLLYLTICNIHIRELYNQKEIIEEKTPVRNKDIEPILNDINLSRQMIINLRRRNNKENIKKLNEIERNLKNQNIVIVWSGDDSAYPNFYKITKKTA